MNTNKILDAYYSTDGNDYRSIAKKIAKSTGENYDDVLNVILADEGLTLADVERIPDTDSGLGIGGINNDQSAPFVPSIKAAQKMDATNKRTRKCCRCGQTDTYHGAMFTTLSGGNICDDCY